MAWTEIRERGRDEGMRYRESRDGGMEYRDGGRMEETIEKVKKAKKLIMEICEDLEDPEMRGSMSERRGYRVYEDDDMDERRGRRRY